MKKIVLIVGVLIIIMVSYFTFTKSNEKTYTKQDDIKPVITIMLYKESGFVTWKNVGDLDYKRVETNEIALPNNVYVKTVEGRGYVVLPDNSSIALATNTEILVNYQPQHVSIEQLLGTTYHRVEALVTGATYEVRTAGTLASVRGTKFSVTYDSKKKKTRVAVTEHKVDIAPIDSIEAIATSTPQSIVEGKVATLIDKPEVSGEATSQQQPSIVERVAVIQSMDAVPEEEKWLEENRVVDTLLDKQKDANDKRKVIKDILQELKQEIPQEETNKTAIPPKNRIKVLKEVIKKIEIKQKLPITEGTKPEEENTKPTRERTRERTRESTTTEIVPVVQKQTTTNGTLAPNVLVPTLKVFKMTTEVLSPEDQKFIDTFYALYEKYLAVDAELTVCRTDVNETETSIVTALEKIANSAGYSMPNKTEITALAKSIISSCKDGSIGKNIQQLQTQFDVDYPFAQ